ncbi:MAG: hypothetical protein IJU14_06910 [Clostridia bacterium]|nr:hypothetical protein [Clostridia bacterium]
MLRRIINFLINILAVSGTLIVIILVLFSDMILEIKDTGTTIMSSNKSVNVEFDTDPLVINSKEVDFMRGVKATDEDGNDVKNKLSSSVVNEDNKKYVVYSINGSQYELQNFKRKLTIYNYRLPTIKILKSSYTCDINEIDEYIKTLITDGQISGDDGLGNDISTGIYRDKTALQITKAGSYDIPLVLNNVFGDEVRNTLRLKVTGKLYTVKVKLTTETTTIRKNSRFSPNSYIASATDSDGNDILNQIIYRSEVDLTTEGRYKVYYYVVGTGEEEDPVATLTVVVTA